MHLYPSEYNKALNKIVYCLQIPCFLLIISKGELRFFPLKSYFIFFDTHLPIFATSDI